MYWNDTFKQFIGIPYYSNLRCNTLGMDSAEYCFNQQHYKSYPEVSYQFNEVGFRFDLKPLTEQPILAVGDSFTRSEEHTSELQSH